MIIKLISFTRKGANLCKSLKDKLSNKYDVEGYAIEKFSIESDLSPIRGLDNWAKDNFNKGNALIFIGACGIAVRAIAPYIKDKVNDPAVIVIDEKGENIIPILSGHIGGANFLTMEIGKLINGRPIITTATDINNRFSVDSFAVKNNLYINSMKIAKDISSKVLEGEKIGFICDFPISGELPNDLTLGAAETGIVISIKNKKPFISTLNLIPKVVSLGIGCRKDKSLESIEDLVLNVLEKHNISIFSIKNICSIDIKANEKGIINFSKKYNIDFITFTPERLLEATGDFTKSNFVKQVTGVDNVCERAAVIGSQGEIIVRKTSKNGVTAALGMEKGGICFEN